MSETCTYYYLLYFFLFILEHLEQLSIDIQNLVNDIEQTETDISGVSSGSLVEANRILRQVKQIEAGAQQSLTTATESLTVSADENISFLLWSNFSKNLHG